MAYLSKLWKQWIAISVSIEEDCRAFKAINIFFNLSEEGHLSFFPPFSQRGEREVQTCADCRPSEDFRFIYFFDILLFSADIERQLNLASPRRFLNPCAQVKRCIWSLRKQEWPREGAISSSINRGQQRQRSRLSERFTCCLRSPELTDGTDCEKCKSSSCNCTALSLKLERELPGEQVVVLTEMLLHRRTSWMMMMMMMMGLKKMFPEIKMTERQPTCKTTQSHERRKHFVFTDCCKRKGQLKETALPRWKLTERLNPIQDWPNN